MPRTQSASRHSCRTGGPTLSRSTRRDRADFTHRLDRLSAAPWVTPALVALNLCVFALMAMDGAGIIVADPGVAMKWGSNFAPLTMDGAWWRLFTAMFIHFGILHVTLNMWALYLSGKTAERLSNT